MNRRQFIGGVAASLVVPGLRAAADDKRRFPFGFSLYGAPGVAPIVALPALARIGYDCVELSCLTGSPTAPTSLSTTARRELRALLGDNRLALASLMENLTEPSEDGVHRTNLERLQAACELGHELSPAATPVVETI